MLKIKDYLVLKDIERYLLQVLEEQKLAKLIPNNIQSLEYMINGLEKIFSRLEKE